MINPCFCMYHPFTLSLYIYKYNMKIFLVSGLRYECLIIFVVFFFFHFESAGDHGSFSYFSLFCFFYLSLTH